MEDVPMVWSTLPDGSQVGSTPWSVTPMTAPDGTEWTLEGPTTIYIWSEK